MPLYFIASPGFEPGSQAPKACELDQLFYEAIFLSGRRWFKRLWFKLFLAYAFEFLTIKPYVEILLFPEIRIEKRNSAVA